MNIYYFYPLRFNFNSGMTLQVIRDYTFLSRLSYNVHLFGTYEEEEKLKEIQDYIGDASLFLLALKGGRRWNRHWAKLQFLWKMLKDREDKIVISRNYNKINEALSWKLFLGSSHFCLEMHEDAFPHLLSKNKRRSDLLWGRYARLFHRLDALILTNFSQESILSREFRQAPKYEVFPNGVEMEKFSKALPPKTPPNKRKRFVITYTGQFTEWKNVELLFSALRYLDDRYILRIAGGKGDKESEARITHWSKKYGVEGRVEYKGFVPPEELVSKILNGSSALLLPLGDNIESRYFTSPMKLFEYIATSIPLVAIDFPSVNGVVNETLIHLSPCEAKAFAKKIEEAIFDKESAEKIALRKEFAKRFSYETRSKRFAAFLHSLKE